MTGRESQLHLYIWHDRFLYVGPSKATSLHRNHAAVWLNASAGQMHVTLGDGTVLADNIIYIPSGTEYSTEEAQAAIAALFWEPESASFLRVADHFSSLPRALGNVGFAFADDIGTINPRLHRRKITDAKLERTDLYPITAIRQQSIIPGLLHMLKKRRLCQQSI